MSQSEKQKGGTKLRLDADIEEAVWLKSVRIKTPLNRIVNAMLRAWVSDTNANAPPTTALAPPADAAKLRRAASAARQLAEQLDAIAGNVPDSEPTLTISYSALISMIQEIRKNGPDTSDSTTDEDLAQRVRARLGEDSAAPASDNSGTVRGPGRKRSAAG